MVRSWPQTVLVNLNFQTSLSRTMITVNSDKVFGLHRLMANSNMEVGSSQSTGEWYTYSKSQNGLIWDSQKDQKVEFFIYKQWMKFKFSRAKMLKTDIEFFLEKIDKGMKRWRWCTYKVMRRVWKAEDKGLWEDFRVFNSVAIVPNIRLNKEGIGNTRFIEKISRTILWKFNSIVCTPKDMESNGRIHRVA